MRPRRTALAIPLALCASLAGGLVAPRDAGAFCGFYVGSADQKLFNNATMVVLMREGTRTVLSMQNNYQGPPEDFALVVPVPVVLQKENVKTLPRDLFDKVDALAAPRLVEYWEQDPCPPDRDHDGVPESPPPQPTWPTTTSLSPLTPARPALSLTPGIFTRSVWPSGVSRDTNVVPHAPAVGRNVLPAAWNAVQLP